MFSIPQPPTLLDQDLTPCLPVIDVEESGVIPNSLLRCIHPVPKSHTTVKVAPSGLLAAQKYEMEVALSTWQRKDGEISDFRFIHCNDEKRAVKVELHAVLKGVRVPSWCLDICQDVIGAKRMLTEGPLSKGGISVDRLTDQILTSCSSCKQRLLRKGVDEFHSVLMSEMEKAASQILDPSLALL
ncbi:hypothetical protein ACEPAH_3741 [Sanghuangporus vaninii]